MFFSLTVVFTLQSAVLVRPLSYLAPPSSQAGSFFTAHSSSSSAKSQNDAASTPAHSPLDADQNRGPEYESEGDDYVQHMLPKERSFATGSGRRPKFSNSSTSSAMAVPTLQPLDERFEDSLEVGDELEHHETSSQSLAAVHGRRVVLYLNIVVTLTFISHRRSMPQLVTAKKALG